MPENNKPCSTCKLVGDPSDCERKNCPAWQTWFLSEWENFNRFYEKYKKGTEENEGT